MSTPSTGAEPVELAAALLEAAPRGTIVVAPSRQILGFDGGAERLTGLSAAQALGFSTSILPDVLKNLIDEALASNGALNSRSVSLPATNGEPRPLTASTQLVRDANGALLSVQLELQGTHQAQGIAARLEHLDRLAKVGFLTASVAHEIKNALVAVRTFVDLLQERNKDDELSALVSKEMARIGTAVRQVLRDSTREQVALAPVGVHALLQESVGLMRKQFEEHSIRPTLQLEAPSDRINGDERQLRHALLNLLMNSMEAMAGAPGRIEVSSSLSAMNGRRDLCLRITDTGCGIPPDHLSKLFSPFFTTKKDGTGLGLAIAHQIIKQHQGDITVESKVNEGTTFQVRLPLL